MLMADEPAPPFQLLQEYPDRWRKLRERQAVTLHRNGSSLSSEYIGANPKPFIEQMPKGALQELNSMVTLPWK